VTAPGSLSHLLVDGLSIILIDLLLAGDNALVIALASRSLPPRERRLGILFGMATAVVLRIALTIIAAKLLDVPWIKLIGGAFVIWIAIKVLADASSSEDNAPVPGQLLRAILYIAMADITMSTDNVLAIAGASKGSMELIILGLGLSIPLVMFSSTLIVHLMDRYPWTLYLGAAILGKVGGEMMITDPAVVRALHPSETALYAVQAVAIAGILIAGKIRAKPRSGGTKT